MEPVKLSVNHQKFVNHYTIHGVAVAAYLHAYPESSYEAAMSSASDLLRNPNIQDAIKKKQEENQIKYNITRDSMMKELTETAEYAKANGDLKSYSKLKDMIIKLFGLYEPEKLNVIGDISVIKITPTKKDDQ